MEKLIKKRQGLVDQFCSNLIELERSQKNKASTHEAC